MNIALSLGSGGKMTISPERKTDRLPSFKTVFIRSKSVVGVLADNTEYPLCSVPFDDTVIESFNKYEITLYSQQKQQNKSNAYVDKKRLNILYGRICPYCNRKSELLHSSVFYGAGVDYGYVWGCKPCGAYVGVHKGDSYEPLGRLANAELRKLKVEAHYWFDGLWKHKIEKDKVPRKVARNKGYEWLAGVLGIHRLYCHIGMFDEEQCKKVIEECKKYYGKR